MRSFILNSNGTQDKFWQHPMKPAYLLEEVTVSCQQLLSDFHFQFGQPFQKAWSVNPSESGMDSDNLMSILSAGVNQISEYILSLKNSH